MKASRSEDSEAFFLRRGLVPALARHVGLVLTIVGGVSLFWTAVSWTVRRIVPGDVRAFVKPVCEHFVFGDSAVGPESRLRDVGVDIYSEGELAGARLRLRGISNIVMWGMQSDGTSRAEATAWVRTLPKGEIDGDVVTPIIPTLSPKSRTTIAALATIPGDSTCAAVPVFAEIFGGSDKIFQADPTFFSMQGRKYQLSDGWLFGAVAVIYALTIVVLYVLAKRRGLLDEGPPRTAVVPDER